MYFGYWHRWKQFIDCGVWCVSFAIALMFLTSIYLTCQMALLTCTRLENETTTRDLAGVIKCNAKVSAKMKIVNNKNKV